jgi:hypothetical protein
MHGEKKLIVGGTEKLNGDVTTLNWIGAKNPEAVEEALGYHRGRLAKGYWIALLLKRLKAEDFTFAGTTLRSGGKFGKPGGTPAEEAARGTVHDSILQECGETGYAFFQKSVLSTVEYTGHRRIAKVIPVIKHSKDMLYPMGGGGLQWHLRRECDFLVAAFVDPSGVAETPAFKVDIVNGPPATLYDNKHKLHAFLQQA